MSTSVSARRIFRHDADIGHTFIPHLRARIPHESGGYLVECNQFGFRSSRPFAATRPANTSRVLIFGDSFTAGDGVSNRDRYSDVLESRFHNKLEVFNFGLSGTGTDQQFLSYKKYGTHIETDLLVLGVYVENIRRNLAHYRPFLDSDKVLRFYPKPWFSLTRDGTLELEGTPVPRRPIDPRKMTRSQRKEIDQGGVLANTRQFIRRLGPNWKSYAQQISRYQPLPEYRKENNYGWQLMRTIIAQWVTIADAPVVLFPIPIYQYIEKTANAEHMRIRFRELADSVGCGLVDPLPALWKLSKDEQRSLRFPEDPHPTKLFHRILATILGEKISEMLNK